MSALRDRVYEALARSLAFDAEQLRVLDLAGSNPRAHVRGTAGTGKTVVARELCMRRAAAGERVRYLCFTDALARAVDRSFADARRGGLDVRAHAIRRLALRLARAPMPADDRGWAATLRTAARAAPEAMGPVDLVVIDEAQDLSGEDWDLVRSISADGGLWLFSDPLQRFWHDRAIPTSLRGLPTLDLPHQQRLPADVERLALRYAGLQPADDDPIDPAVVRVLPTPPERTIAVLEREVAALLHQGIEPRHVAVLTLAGQSRSRILDQGALAGGKTVRADDDAMADHLVLDTALRFKGLERPIILIAELAIAGTQRHHDIRMHIALTRALAAITVLATPTALGADARLAALQPA